MTHNDLPLEQLAQMLSRLEGLLSAAQQKQADIRSQIDDIVRKA